MQSLGVGIIVRDSEKTIKACIESFIEHVDQCVIVKAGESTDKTPQILDDLKEKYPDKIELYDFEWIDDFSAARNFSFGKLNTDWLFWCDGDDVIHKADRLRYLIDNAQDEVGAIWLPYHYAVDEFGNVTTLYERERILRAKFKWLWQSRLHETLICMNECKFVRSDEVIVVHRHLSGGQRNDRNFKLLNIMLKESPDDKRVWLYLGHQNFAARNFNEAAEWYLKFGTDTGAMPIERYQALCYCSKALRELKDKQAIDVALMAVELHPNYRDAYLEMAHSYMMVGDLDKALHWVTVSDIKELITEPPHVIFINPLDYGFNKFCLLGEIYMKKGDYKTAVVYLTHACEIRPTQELKGNMDYVKILELRDRVSESIKVLSVDLLNNKEILKLEHLLRSTPYWFKDLDDYKMLESGVTHYLKEAEEIEQVIEGDNNSVLVNISNVKDTEKLLEDMDKYDNVTVVCPVPKVNSKQIRACSQKDMEELVMSREGRHIINLQREQSRIICEYDHKIPQDLSVRMFVGRGLEYWNPKTIDMNGCGGSETAAALVCKELASRDCQPLLYAMDTQVWDGVIYRLYSQFNASHPCHLFISSRQPDIFNEEIPSKQKWLWCHDIHCFDRLTPDIAEKLDAIIALTWWHALHLKRVYPFLKDAKVIDLDGMEQTYDDLWTGGTWYGDAVINKVPAIAIIGDAIDTRRFETQYEERIPNRFIWCSSPDRGLEQALEMWPLIKERIPDAELKIFYGWDYFDHSLAYPGQKEIKEKLLKLIKQDGVEWCGRIGQSQIVRELQKADVMPYPPHDFRETYGIAFLEAQAAGVLCFYRQNGALGETIGGRGIPLAMDMTHEQVADKIATTLKDKELCDIIRDKAKEFAMNRTWANQAEKMLSLYRRLDNGQDNSN